MKLEDFELGQKNSTIDPIDLWLEDASTRDEDVMDLFSSSELFEIHIEKITISL